jgi:hypothetical protein
LIDHGFSILIQIDDAHRANCMAVTTTNTFFLIDFHFSQPGVAETVMAKPLSKVSDGGR